MSHRVKQELLEYENPDFSSGTLESDITIEYGRPQKREKTDEDSSCSAEMSTDGMEGLLPNKRDRQAFMQLQGQPFLPENNWDDDTEIEQGAPPSGSVMGGKRRPNFTQGELEALVSHMAGVLELQQSGATWLQLQEAWEQAAQHVNSVGHHRRSSREIKAKWRDLKSKVKCKAAARGRRSTTSLNSLEKKVMVVLNKAKSAQIPLINQTLPRVSVTSIPVENKEPRVIVTEAEIIEPDLVKPVSRLSLGGLNGNGCNTAVGGEWQGWEAQTAERNAELLNRRATVPGQASELAEISAEMAETGVWLAAKRNVIMEKRLALEERRTATFERLLQLLESS